MARNHLQGGNLRIRQRKTSRTVHVPPPRPLRELLEALPADQMLFMVDEHKHPYSVDRLSRRLRAVLDALAAADADWAELQLRDRCRTGVVALAEAGCTIPEIAAISGHDIEECERIVSTYLPRTVPLAKAAIRKWDRKLKRD